MSFKHLLNSPIVFTWVLRNRYLIPIGVSLLIFSLIEIVFGNTFNIIIGVGIGIVVFIFGSAVYELKTYLKRHSLIEGILHISKEWRPEPSSPDVENEEDWPYYAFVSYRTVLQTFISTVSASTLLTNADKLIIQKGIMEDLFILDHDVFKGSMHENVPKCSFEDLSLENFFEKTKNSLEQVLNRCDTEDMELRKKYKMPKSPFDWLKNNK